MCGNCGAQSISEQMRKLEESEKARREAEEAAEAARREMEDRDGGKHILKIACLLLRLLACIIITEKS